jgi:hypothetical protein
MSMDMNKIPFNMNPYQNFIGVNQIPMNNVPVNQMMFPNNYAFNMNQVNIPNFPNQMQNLNYSNNTSQNQISKKDSNNLYPDFS